MKHYELKVGEVKTFPTADAEMVGRNIQEAIDGRTLSADDLPRLYAVLAALPESGFASTVVFHKDLIEVIAEDFTVARIEIAESRDEFSELADIISNLRSAGLITSDITRRERFYENLDEDEKDAADLLDSYMETRMRVPEFGGKPLLADFKSSVAIADDLENMIVIDERFITRYMMANGFNPTTISDGSLRWQMWRIIPGAF